MVFAGQTSRRLGEAIAGRLGVRLGASEAIRRIAAWESVSVLFR